MSAPISATAIGLLRAMRESLDSDDADVDATLLRWVHGLTQHGARDVILELLLVVCGTAEAGGLDLADFLKRAGLDAAQ